MLLNRFQNHKEYLSLENLNFVNAQTIQSTNWITDTNGDYEYLNNQLIAIFTYEGDHYLYLNDSLIELTSHISIECKIAQDRESKSWFKIYDKEKLIYEIEYINPHDPMVLPSPFDTDEDFNTTNFADHLKSYINRIKENSNREI